MSNIYAIRNNLDYHKELDLGTMDLARFAPEDIDPDDVLDFSYTNKPMSGWWKTPETVFLDVEGLPGGCVPDISVWAAGACLILSPKAYRYSKDSLAQYGEFLPVIVSGDEYQIFNCLTLAEINDSSNELLVFKSKEDNCTTLYCSKRMNEVVHMFELQGACFDNV